TLYRRWSETEARGNSPCYERLTLAIAESPAAIDFLSLLPRGKRQPNLLLAALRWFGAPVEDPPATLAFLTEHAGAIRTLMLNRATQTNEAARCAVLLPGLALLPEPLVILELGASAGLCLLLDAWGYDWTDATTGTLARLGAGGCNAASGPSTPTGPHVWPGPWTGQQPPRHPYARGPSPKTCPPPSSSCAGSNPPPPWW